MEQLDFLSEDERTVVAMREGLLDGHKYSYRIIAEKVGFSDYHNAFRVYRRAQKMIRERAQSLQYDAGNDVSMAAVKEAVALFPTLTWVPNMAQRRILAPWEKPPYPFMVVASCGNGAGKTDTLPQDIVGCLCGPEYLNDCWNVGPDGNPVGALHYQYYHDCKALREKGEFCYRILCGPDDMKENGSLYTAIKKYIPTAQFKGKMSTGAYKQVEIPLPHNPKVKNYIDVKTFDQEVVAQAGANLHRIAINEPPPFSVWTETIARVRSKKNEVQCTILLNATILDQATWIFTLEEDPFFDGKIVYVQGSIYENVVGEDITDDIADECEKRLGYRFPVDPVTGHYVTYGHLSLDSVNIQIHTYEKTDPNQVESRIWGANVRLVGSEFKQFCKAIHVTAPRVIPKNVMVVQVVDPHPVKPDLCAWFWVDPMNYVRCFQEWPEKSWEKLHSRDVTISQTCEQWRKLEDQLGITDQVVARVGDPNRFKTSDSRDLSELWQLYVPHGFVFDLFVSDNIDYGHQLIHSALYNNKEIYAQNPNDPAGWPRLTMGSNCLNMATALMYYGRKANKDPMAAVNEQLDKTYKDAIDLLRYFCVWIEHRSYFSLQELLNSDTGGDYAKIQQGRSMDGYESPIPVRKLKGRRLDSVISGGNYGTEG